MTLTNDERDALVSYRIQKASDTAEPDKVNLKSLLSTNRKLGEANYTNYTNYIEGGFCG